MPDPQYDTTRQWLETTKLDHDASAVFVSGSVVRGWGHAQSDLDLYVVTERSLGADPMVRFVDVFSELTSPGVPVAVDWFEGTKMDAEIWSPQQFDELIGLFEQPPTVTNWELLLPDKYLDTMYRVSIAEALSGPDWLATAQERVRHSHVRHVAARRALDTADSYLEDAVGFVQSRAETEAVTAAHIAFGLVVDAIVALGGEYQPSPKWRARRVQAVGSPSLDLYWSVFTMAELPTSGALKWAENTVRTARTMAANIEL